MIRSLFNSVSDRILGAKWRPEGDGSTAVNYDLADGDQSIYPQLLAPRRGTAIVQPVAGKGYKRGPGELWLSIWLKVHRIKNFYNNLALPTGGHRYEPDFAYIDERRGIYIDIEVDEPYTMGQRIPTHVIGKDDRRNGLVTAAGWTVLRFSERQCIATPARVARAVIDVARSIDPTVEMPKALAKASPAEPDARWNLATARAYAESRYRDTYLERHLPFYRLTNLFYR